jgi:1-acyl-sn-glycerol-3-phosphate acyltransferase
VFRMVYVLIYMGLYLLYSIPTLHKVKRLDVNMSVEERDGIIHDLPKRWSRGIMKRTGSNVHIRGQESIPTGPVLFVANHSGCLGRDENRIIIKKVQPYAGPF